MATNRLTVRELRDQLADFDPDLQVWVLDRASDSGYSPVLGTYPGSDPDPGAGDPDEFVALDVEQ